MLVVGTFTLAIAAAFYYNFGAWGVGKTMGKSAAEVKEEYKRVAKLSKGRALNFYRSHGLLCADGADLQGRLVRRLSVAFTDALYFFNTGKPVAGVKFEQLTDLELPCVDTIGKIAFFHCLRLRRARVLPDRRHGPP